MEQLITCLHIQASLAVLLALRVYESTSEHTTTGTFQHTFWSDPTRSNYIPPQG